MKKFDLIVLMSLFVACMFSADTPSSTKKAKIEDINIKPSNNLNVEKEKIIEIPKEDQISILVANTEVQAAYDNLTMITKEASQMVKDKEKIRQDATLKVMSKLKIVNDGTYYISTREGRLVFMHKLDVVMMPDKSYEQANKKPEVKK